MSTIEVTVAQRGRNVGIRSQLSWLILAVALTLVLGGLLLQRGPTASTLPTAPVTVSLTTDQPSYLPGQLVTMTLTNRGTGSLGLPADPPYVVRQGKATVYRPVVAIPRPRQSAVTTLEPSVGHDWTWDQFTLDGLIAPGQYNLVVSYLSGRTVQTITTPITIQR